MCDHNCAIVPPLLLEYYEAKVQMLSVFSWKGALGNAAERQNTNFLSFKSELLEVTLFELWRKI